jgi:hypothetical protein
MHAKKLNHFVARFYLKAWATDDQIWCLRDGITFSRTQGISRPRIISIAYGLSASKTSSSFEIR